MLLGIPTNRKPIPPLIQHHAQWVRQRDWKRGLYFVRYADDCAITVGSETATKRVMYFVSRFIEKRLGLKVNMTKTKIVRLSKLKYLGFRFWKSAERWKNRLHQDGVQSSKRKLRKLTIFKWSKDLDSRIAKLNKNVCRTARTVVWEELN